MRLTWWKRRKDLDARVQRAEREAEEARERLARTREEVVKPLRRMAENNQFAQMIRESLLNGGH
jgi:hypothetical protein